MQSLEEIFEDFYREEGNRICFDPVRLEKVVILHMLVLVEHQVEPTWENFKATQGWNNIKKRLSKEAQFNYRNCWLRTLRKTWPAPTP